MDVTSNLIGNCGVIPDIIPSNLINGSSCRKSSSFINLEEQSSVKKSKKENNSIPTSFSCNQLSSGAQRANNIIGSNSCDGVDEVFDTLMVRARTGTADGSTQTHPCKGSRMNIRKSNLIHGSSSSVRTDSSDSENTELDGGFWAWIVVLGAFLTNGIIFGVINCFGVIFKQIQTEFGGGDTSSFLTSCVGSLAIGMTFLCSFIASICTDCFGIRRTAVFGGILATTGMFCSSYATSFTHLYITYGIMFGVGASLAYTPSLVILGHYFSKRLGIVNGVVTAGSSVFTMIMSVSLKALSESNDFKTNMRILAGLMSLLILCGLTFIERKPRTGKNIRKPMEEDCNRISGKYAGGDLCRRMSATSLSSSLATTASTATNSKVFNTDIWKNKLYVLWSLAIPVALFGYFVPYVHLVEHVRLVLPDVNGAILVTTIGASSGIGRLIFGNIADAPGVNRIFLQQIAFLSIGFLTLLLTITTNFYCLLAICVGLGIFDGCFIAVLGPIAFDLVGKAGAPQAIGFLLAFCSVPLTVGPPVAGKIFDAFKSYKYAFLIAGIPPFLGALMMCPIFNRQRSMAAAKELENQKKMEEEETSSGTGVSPTVITGLSSASPSNILMNQSSSEDHTSLDIVDEDQDTTEIQEHVLNELIRKNQEQDSNPNFCNGRELNSPFEPLIKCSVTDSLLDKN